MRFLAILVCMLPLSTLAAPSLINRQSGGTNNDDRDAQSKALTSALQHVDVAVASLAGLTTPPTSLDTNITFAQTSVRAALSSWNNVLKVVGQGQNISNTEYVDALNNVVYKIGRDK